MPTETSCVIPSSDELGRLFAGVDKSCSPLYGQYANPQQLRDYRLVTLLQSIESGETRAHTTRTGDELTGLATWRTLPWDTQQLKISTARIETLVASQSGESREGRLLEALLRDVVEDCKSAGVGYLTARVDAGDVASIHSLEQSGFRLIDSIQTLSRDLNAGPPQDLWDETVHVRPFETGDLEDVLHIARTSYVCDRFHTDPAISPQTADAIHEAWLRNSCAGIACDQVIVGHDESGVTSYVTCKVDRERRAATGLFVGTIVMVATAVRTRGQGWALAATLRALHWFREQGVQIVEVGTQLRNTGAASLYQKARFRPTAANFTFRRLLPFNV